MWYVLCAILAATIGGALAWLLAVNRTRSQSTITIDEQQRWSRCWSSRGGARDRQPDDLSLHPLWYGHVGMAVFPQVIVALALLGTAFGLAAVPLARRPRSDGRSPLGLIVPHPRQPSSMLSFA
jgi:hypothetical protein